MQSQPWPSPSLPTPLVSPMWLPTTPSPSPALLPAVLRVWGMWLFLRGFCGEGDMVLIQQVWHNSPAMLPFRSRMETTWTSPPAPACWQWLKISLKTTGTAARLTWTYLLTTFLLSLMCIPLLSPVSVLWKCVQYCKWCTCIRHDAMRLK